MTVKQKLTKATAVNKKLLLAAKCIRFEILDSKGFSKTSDEWNEYLRLECEIKDCL